MSAASVSRTGLPLSQLSATASGTRFSSIASAIRFRTLERSVERGLAPGVLRGVGGVERELDVLGARLRHLGERLAGRRRQVRRVLPCDRRDPVAADEVLVARLQRDGTLVVAGCGVHRRFDGRHQFPFLKVGLTHRESPAARHLFSSGRLLRPVRESRTPLDGRAPLRLSCSFRDRPRQGRERPVSQIVLDSVTKVFEGDVHAVDDVSLTITSGEFMVLVGPSGCGKSTLLRMIAGLEEVTDGIILLGERDVTDASPRNRDIAMVFQDYALYPHMTVRAEPRLRAQGAQDAEGARSGSASTRRRPCSGSRISSTGAGRSSRAASASGSRWDGRSCASRRVPVRRAALEPRREAARRDARRALAPARAARRDDRLRHPRPGRGDDARTARGGHARRDDPAGGRAPGALPRADQSLRGRLHRLAGDEPRRGDDRGRSRRFRRLHACRSTASGVRPTAPPPTAR